MCVDIYVDIQRRKLDNHKLKCKCKCKCNLKRVLIMHYFTHDAILMVESNDANIMLDKR